jgi:hypothetical protein
MSSVKNNIFVLKYKHVVKLAKLNVQPAYVL